MLHSLNLALCLLDLPLENLVKVPHELASAMTVAGVGTGDLVRAFYHSSEALRLTSDAMECTGKSLERAGHHINGKFHCQGIFAQCVAVFPAMSAPEMVPNSCDAACRLSIT